MSNLNDLTNKEIQEKILKIFNNNPWVLKPNLNELDSYQKNIYSQYQTLKEHLEDRKGEDIPCVPNYHNNVPYKRRIFS